MKEINKMYKIELTNGDELEYYDLQLVSLKKMILKYGISQVDFVRMLRAFWNIKLPSACKFYDDILNSHCAFEDEVI
jgi:hypothetical protein